MPLSAVLFGDLSGRACVDRVEQSGDRAGGESHHRQSSRYLQPTGARRGRRVGDPYVHAELDVVCVQVAAAYAD